MDQLVYLAASWQASHRDGAEDPATMMGRAITGALADGQIDPTAVDVLACVEPLSWNYDDIAANVAAESGISADVETAWVPAGGTSPQDLIHQLGPRLRAGEIDCAVICGAESMRSRRRGHVDGWPERASGVNPMRGQAAFSSELERRHGLSAPLQLFPLIENALQAANGRTASEQSHVAASLLARNAAVAATNPHAWFQDAPSAETIGEVSTDNRMIVHPYTKRTNAIMDIDQSAAIVLTSASFAQQRKLTERSAAILAGAGSEEVWNPIERERLDVCRAMERAFRYTLDAAGLDASEIDAMDLYSCFPSAVELAMDALGVPLDDARPVSLTGGLAFAGGPGNAYVLHSLATALAHLRRSSSEKILVTGIGMANTKHAATLLTGPDHVPAAASGAMVYRLHESDAPMHVLERADGRARVISYTIEYERAGTPRNVIWLLSLDNGNRTIANTADGEMDIVETILDDEIVGRCGVVRFEPGSQRNLFHLD